MFDRASPVREVGAGEAKIYSFTSSMREGEEREK
jgi:hypothetical protein